MGNCIRHNHSCKTWDNDDWSSSTESSRRFDDDVTRQENGYGSKNVKEAEQGRVLGEKKEHSSTEVKLKLSKKEMEELLLSLDIEGMSAEQLLSRFLNASNGDYCLRHQWKPALQSIPEVN